MGKVDLAMVFGWEVASCFLGQCHWGLMRMLPMDLKDTRIGTPLELCWHSLDTLKEALERQSFDA